MTPTSTLTTRAPLGPTSSGVDRCIARFAEYRSLDEPPVVRDLTGDEATVIEDLFALAAEASVLPPLAIREVIENLIHAGFEAASVSVLDQGNTLRVADRGPGIPDKRLALEPGFSTAAGHLRHIVRGVGSGLSVASNVMSSAGGCLLIDDNIAGGTVVTLVGPGASGEVGGVCELSEHARRAMALLVEVGPAAPAAIARELGISLSECGRELVVLEHRRLVERAPDGSRSLTADGADLLSTLF